MTSKTSYNDSIPYGTYIYENIRQRGWLMALSCVMLFLAQTIYTTIHIENFLGASENQNITSYQEQFPHMLNGHYAPFLSLVVLLLAVSCAVSGYAYLHSSEKADFFHGFPLKRTQWFSVSYIGGLLIFLIPYLFSGLCTMGMAAAKGILVSSNFTASVIAVLGRILGFFILYNTSVLAMMLTAKLTVGTLAALVLIVYGSMLTQLFSGLTSRFLDTHYNAHLQNTTELKRALSACQSPFALYSSLISCTAGMQNLPFLLFIGITFAVILWLLARFLYQKRPLEAAGKALVYPKSASVIKVLIAIPTALSIGLLADTFYHNRQNRWIILFSILSVLLLCCVIEFIYTQDLRQIFKRKAASLLSIAGVAGILFFLQLDLFGFDTWLPKKSEIESMALYSSSYDSYLTYPEADSEITADLGGNTALYYTLYDDNAQCKNFDSIYQLAETGIRNHNAHITHYSLSSGEIINDYTSITVRFHKTNGKNVYRSYVVSHEDLLDCLEELCRNEGYRRTLFPAFYIKATDIESLSLNDILSGTSLKLTGEEQAALLKAYQTDTLQTDIHKLQEDSPIGSLFLQLKSEKPLPGSAYNIAPSVNLYLYDTYENTLNALESFGYPVHEKIDPSDVVQMTHTVFTKLSDQSGVIIPDDTETETIVSVTDPQKIAELLDRIAYSSLGIAGWKDDTAESVELWLSGDIYSRYFSLLPEE